MDPTQPVTNTRVINSLKAQFGVKRSVTYYLRKANDAAKRAEINVAAQNPYAVALEVGKVNENLAIISTLLLDESATDEELSKS